MGAWRAIRHRLEETVRTGTAESLTYVGRTWKASPSEGYPTAHQREQDRIEERADFLVSGQVTQTIAREQVAVQRAAVDVARAIVSFAFEGF